MKKKLKIISGLLLVLILLWFSFDLRPLDAFNATQKPEKFDVKNYVNAFWTDSLPVSVAKATEIGDFYRDVENNSLAALKKSGRKLGISKTYYCFLKGNGIVESIENEYVIVSTVQQQKIRIATDFIYGNAVRDGSGKVDINTFLNMTDFNNVSVAINKLVKEKVVIPFKKKVQLGQQIIFTGAMELHSDKINVSEAILIPVSVQLSNGKSK